LDTAEKILTYVHFGTTLVFTIHDSVCMF
jgi:hypothetical protein